MTFDAVLLLLYRVTASVFFVVATVWLLSNWD